MAIARISFSVKSLNFFSIVPCLPASFLAGPRSSVAKKNRTNCTAKSSFASRSCRATFGQGPCAVICDLVGSTGHLGYRMAPTLTGGQHGQEEQARASRGQNWNGDG